MPGGKILIHMRAPDGTVHPMGGVFHEIVPHERIVFTTFVDMPDGTRVLECAQHRPVRGAAAARPRSRCTRDAGGFSDFAAQMLAGMEAGWSQSLDKLAAMRRAQTAHKDADDQAAIRAIFGDRTNALFGKVVDLAVKHFADDVVSYDLDPPLQHVGPDRRRAAGLVRHLGWADRAGRWATSWSRSAAIIAIARGLGHMTGTKKDGDKVDLWARVTVGSCAARRRWKITHQHTSVPFLMDGSFKAAVDLKP